MTDVQDPGRQSARASAGWLPRGAAEIFGEGASAEEAYGLLTVDVPAERWTTALLAARDELDCTYFDWLSAVDEPGTCFRICAHLVALPGGRPAGGGTSSGATGGGTEGGPTAPGGALRRLVLRTTVPHEAPVLPTATEVYAGAAWHERETHEMFGVSFTGHPHLVPLLLPDGFEGHPLRKEFVLAARVAKAWPGAKEPGESGHGGPKRRQMQPPGVPDPNEWGPLKGQLPPAPARAAGRGRPRAAEGERPARRTRAAGAQGGEGGAATARPARRMRSVSEGSASQRAPKTPEAPDTPSRPGSPDARPPGGTESGAGSGTGSGTERRARRGRTGSDAPWHRPRPAASGPEDDRPAPSGAAPEEPEEPGDPGASHGPKASGGAGGPGAPQEPDASRIPDASRASEAPGGPKTTGGPAVPGAPDRPAPSGPADDEAEGEAR